MSILKYQWPKCGVQKKLLVLILIFLTGSPAVAGRFDSLHMLLVLKDLTLKIARQKRLKSSAPKDKPLRLPQRWEYAENMDLATAKTFGKAFAGDFKGLRTILSVVSTMPGSPVSKKILKELMNPTLKVMKSDYILVKENFSDVVNLFYEVERQMGMQAINAARRSGAVVDFSFSKGDLVEKGLLPVVRYALRSGTEDELIVQLDHLNNAKWEWFESLMAKARFENLWENARYENSRDMGLWEMTPPE